MRIIGLDPSLTASGVATPEQVTTLRPLASMKGPERLAWIREQVMVQAAGSLLGISRPDEADLIVLEGYSYASNHQAHQLGELGGILRVALWEAGIPYVTIPPTTLKQYATGDGGAGKPEMLAAAIRRLEYEGHDDNEVDALWLRTAAIDHYSLTQGFVPKVQRDALYAKVKKGPRKGEPIIDWPVLAQRASV